MKVRVQEEYRCFGKHKHRLFVKTWFPENEPPERNPVVIYTHGIESHVGWFAEVAQELAEAGFPILAMDRRGSGRSEGPRGHARSYHHILKDLHHQLEEARSCYPNRPVVLMGLSLGGLLMTALAMQFPQLVSGIVALVPGLASPIRFPASQVARMLVASAVQPKRPYKVPIHPDMFTDNPQWKSFIHQDPHRLTHASARFFWSFLRVRTWVLSHPEQLKTSLLLLLAEKDEIIDNQRIRQWVSKTSSGLVEVKEYKQVKHSIIFEPCRKEVLTDIKGYLSKIGESWQPS